MAVQLALHWGSGMEGPHTTHKGSRCRARAQRLCKGPSGVTFHTPISVILAQCHSQGSPTQGSPFQGDYVRGLALGGVTVDPFVLQRGNEQPNRDPLSERIGGSCCPSPNLPPQRAMPWARCWDLSLRASRESQCHEEAYSLRLPSVPPAAALQFCPTIL